MTSSEKSSIGPGSGLRAPAGDWLIVAMAPLSVAVGVGNDDGAMLTIGHLAELVTCPNCHEPHATAEVVVEHGEEFWLCERCGDCIPLA